MQTYKPTYLQFTYLFNFTRAEDIIPGVIGSIAPVISSVIIPPVSISHSTSISAVLHQKPIALSHSGTISTSSGASTTATGSAVVQKPTLVATSSSSANQVKKLFMSLNIL